MDQLKLPIQFPRTTMIIGPQLLNVSQRRLDAVNVFDNNNTPCKRRHIVCVTENVANN